MFRILVCLSLALALPVGRALAEEGHDHHENEAHENHKDHEEHDKQEGHGDHEKHEGHDDHAGHDDHNDHAGHDGHDEDGGHDDHHGHGAAANLGEGKAVEEYHEDEGRLRLGAKAVKRLGLQWSKPSRAGQAWLLPASALISVRGETFLYFTDGQRWFWSQKVKASPAGEGKISVEGLKASSLAVIQGANFLRLAELDLQAGDSVGHGH